MTKSIQAILQTALVLLASSVPSLAQGCKVYPYRDGIDIEQIANNRFLSTASATVTFDDADSVKDAREEATLEAKAAIAKFFDEDIHSDEALAKMVNESKTTTAAGKEAVRRQFTQKVTVLRSSAKALLKGVVVIGDCYTKGTEVRVTVGVKTETIAAAEGLKAQMTSSKGGATGSGTREATNSSNKQPLNAVEEYSNTKNLKKF